MSTTSTTDVIAKYYEVTDKVLPGLSLSEQAVFLQIFARTIAAGEDSVRVSYGDLVTLTNASLPTVKSALQSLIEKGLLALVGEFRAKIPRRYRIIMPNGGHQMLPERLRREFSAILGNISVGSASPSSEDNIYSGILGKLTPEDREMLEMILDSLSQQESDRYMRLAREAAPVGASDKEISARLREIVVGAKFGPEKLRKYL